MLFEKNVSGELDNKHFEMLTLQYDEEEATLKEQLSALTDELQRTEAEIYGETRFLNAVRKLTEMEIITAPILNELIEKIEVFAVQGKGKNRTQRIVIHYRFVGTLSIPKEENYTLNSRKGVAVEYLTDSKTA